MVEVVVVNVTDPDQSHMDQNVLEGLTSDLGPS